MNLLVRLIDRIADWVVDGIEFSNKRRLQREVHTWTPNYKEDPL